MMEGIMFLVLAFSICLFYKVVSLLVRRVFACGKVLLSPSEGVFKVTTNFHPHHVRIRLLGCAHDVPGCSQLEDTAEVESIDCGGFNVRYKIQTGPRVLKWRAWA